VSRAPLRVLVCRRKIRAGRDFPNKAEVNAILRTATGRWRPLVVAVIFTWMRSSEPRGLL
jgi:hypothetical protein